MHVHLKRKGFLKIKGPAGYCKEDSATCDKVKSLQRQSFFPTSLRKSPEYCVLTEGLHSWYKDQISPQNKANSNTVPKIKTKPVDWHCTYWGKMRVL